ncbi:MAG: hypothetical protein JW973_04880 [Bacteroidales bacterium]|nr:hypothetical protein [Bacteroidales bacterium]
MKNLTGTGINNKCFLINSISLGLFTFLVFYWTVIHNRTYLFKVQDLSLFLSTPMFFLDTVNTPGGLLFYLGSFFTQMFYYPWLGGLVYILFLFGIHFLTIKSFNINKRQYPLSFIPAMLLLLTFSQLGYYIYIIYSNDYVFSNLFGIMIVLGIFRIYRNITRTNLRLLFSLLFSITFFPIAGFYSLVTILLFVVYEFVNIKESNNKDHYIIVLLSLISMISLPFLYFRFLYNNTPFPKIYLSALPEYGFAGDPLLWLPLVFLFAFLIVAVIIFIPSAKWQKPNRPYSYIPVLVFVITAFFVYHYSYDDENFSTELRMEQSIVENDWEEVLALSRNLKGEPTRLIVMDTYLALRKLNVAGNEMFTYKNGNKDIHSRKPVLLMDIAGKMFYYQYGKLNYCYRWCMEDMMSYGMKIENLKYFVKSCLLNKDIPLARKYNDVLKKTLFHKSWAEKYHKFIENQERIYSDPEFSKILPLLAYHDNLYVEHEDQLESFLIYSFASTYYNTPEWLELSMQCNLEYKDIKRFWPLFVLYTDTHAKLPVHYQEAALLYASLAGIGNIGNLKFDQVILNNFQEFAKMTHQYARFSNKEKVKSYFSRRFGKTYWYYYYFFE